MRFSCPVCSICPTPPIIRHLVIQLNSSLIKYFQKLHSVTTLVTKMEMCVQSTALGTIHRLNSDASVSKWQSGGWTSTFLENLAPLYLLLPCRCKIVAFPKRRYPRTRLDGVITHVTVMKRLLPLKHMILCSNQRTSGYRGLFSQGIRQPECKVNCLPRAGADVSFLIYLLT